MRLRIAVVAGLGVLALAGCDSGQDANSNRAQPQQPQPTAPVPPPTARALPTVEIPERLGIARIGMNANDLPGIKRDEPMPGSSCSYATLGNEPHAYLMLDGDTLVRIDVRTPGYETLGGIKVGDSEADVLAKLGKHVTVQPHPYTGPTGHYLVVHKEGAPNGLILETDGKTVQSWRFGRWEQVQWVEGCA